MAWCRWNSTTQNYADKSMIDSVLASKMALAKHIRALPSVSMDVDHRLVLTKCKIAKNSCDKDIKKRKNKSGGKSMLNNNNNNKIINYAK